MSGIVVLKNGKGKDKPIGRLKDGQTRGTQERGFTDQCHYVRRCNQMESDSMRFVQTQNIIPSEAFLCNDILLSFMWNHEP